MPRLVLVLVLVLVLAPLGCSVAPPAELRNDPEVAAAAAKAKRAGAALPKLAMVEVQPAYSPTHDFEKAPGRVPGLLDKPEFSRTLARDVADWTPFGAPLLVEGVDLAAEGVDPRAALVPAFRKAAEEGAGLLLVPRMTRFETFFDRRNGLWALNVGIWLYLWIPAWWVRDEDYAAEAKLDLEVYSVASERLVWKKTVLSRATLSLDDFDRGWDFFSIFRAPESLTAEQMRTAGKAVNPHALRELEKKAVLALDDDLPGALAAGPGGAEAADRDATVYAVLIGVGRYQDDAAVKGPDGAQGDVADMKRLLIERHGVPEKNIETLLDAQATRHRLEALLRDPLGRRVRRADTVLVYFSGCGASGRAPAPAPPAAPAGGEAAREAYLLTFDASSTDIPGTAVALGALAEKLRALPAARAVLLADASFGPGEWGSRTIAGVVGGRPLPPAAFERASAAGKGKDMVILLAAGGGDGAAGEDALDLVEARRGLFTYLLIDGARSRADSDASGDVSIEELGAYVAQQVRAQAGLEGAVQSPALWRNGARVALQAKGGESWLPVARDGRLP